jgi:hypothetical protein
MIRSTFNVDVGYRYPLLIRLHAAMSTSNSATGHTTFQPVLQVQQVCIAGKYRGPEKPKNCTLSMSILPSDVGLHIRNRTFLPDLRTRLAEAHFENGLNIHRRVELDDNLALVLRNEEFRVRSNPRIAVFAG